MVDRGRVTRAVRACLALAAAALAAGCDQAPVAAPPSLAVGGVGRGARGSIPTRAEEARAARMRHWSEESDDSLWSAAAATDTIFSVGLKAPGAVRGIWRGKWLVKAAEAAEARASLGRLAGLEIVSVDSILPAVRVKVPNSRRLAVLRNLPFVDYVAPARPRVLLASDGCATPEYTGPRSYHGAWFDVISPVLTNHLVEQAWRYSTGENVTLGMSDTGVEADPGSEFRNGQFQSGASGGRTHYFAISRAGYVAPPIGITCDHGTNLAGIMVAPLNGVGVVGIAYRASFINVNQDDDVWPEHVNAENAIPLAVAPNLLSSGGSSRVVNLSWGLLTWHDAIADHIKYYEDPPYDVLFVGAAGTGFTWYGVLFPASMAEVLAVSSSDDAGNRPGSAHEGPKVELAAFIDGPTMGAYKRPPYDSLDKVGGSSAATAVVSGVATLVRSRYPTMSASAVRQRLTSTAGPGCGMINAWAPLVNALAAVGGICFNRDVQGPGSVNTYYNFTTLTPITVSASASGGAGTLRYVWSNGASGPQTTYWLRRGNYDTTITLTVHDLATGAYVTSWPKTVGVHAVAYSGSISGPSDVPPYESCLWSASSTHTDGALTYQWSVNDSPAGDGSPYLRYSGSSGGFTINVTITDSNGNPVYASRYVSVSNYAASCLDS